MLDTAPHIANLAQVIQLAVAPVFLLAGVGTTLNALATRVGRIIDRARTMEDRLLTASPEQAEECHKLLRVLSKRATLINRAIGLSVTCGFLVSLVVAALFISSSLGINLDAPIAITFVVALACLAAGPGLFPARSHSGHQFPDVRRGAALASGSEQEWQCG